MIIGNLDTSKEVLVVAEIGNNHEGDLSLAKKLVEEAANAGVQAVKLQKYYADDYISSSDKDRLARLKRFQLSFNDFADLKQLADSLGVLFFATPFDLKSANELNEIQSVFKISSGDNNFFDLIRCVGNFEKPTMISLGLANLFAIEELVRFWTHSGFALDQLALLHCVSAYPVPESQLNLGFIRVLRKKLNGITVGYSDHSLGIDAAKYAVSAGADIIEKHFTLDKQFSDFRDHQLSADPAEMNLLVNEITKINLLMGDGSLEVSPCELDSVSSMRRSCAARIDLKKGDVLARSHVKFVRPGDGVPLNQKNTLIGRRLLTDVEGGCLLMESMFEKK